MLFLPTRRDEDPKEDIMPSLIASEIVASNDASSKSFDALVNSTLAKFRRAKQSAENSLKVADKNVERAKRNLEIAEKQEDVLAENFMSAVKTHRFGDASRSLNLIGVPVDINDGQALVRAIIDGDAEAVTFLLNHRAKPGSYHYGSPLYQAVKAARPDLVDVLLRHHAELSGEKDSDNPLFEAVERNDPKPG